MSKHPSTPSARNVIASNRKAFRDYQILERFEAGIQLQGTEVKSIRARNVSLQESFAKVEQNEIVLHNLHIQPYEYGNQFNHDPIRPRRLLLHRREIRRLIGQISEKSRTLIPLSLYLKRGLVKVELGLCVGKQLRDKREDLRRKTDERETARAMALKQRTRD